MKKLIAVALVAGLGACSDAVAPNDATLEVPGRSSAVSVTDGVGFVGKGDVQLAFGWNNKTAQDQAKNVSFAHVATEAYVAVCTFTTGEGTRGEKVHNVNHKRTSAVNSAVAYDARKTGQYTGYNLSGFSSTTSDGETPVVGAPCMGNAGHDGEWTSVELDAANSFSMLQVTWSGITKDLPNTLVL